MLKAIIDTKVKLITVIVNGFFFIFLSIFKPADKIKKTTQTCIPLKADATQVTDKNWLKNKEIKKIIVNDGIIIPRVAIIEPKIFSFL